MQTYGILKKNTGKVVNALGSSGRQFLTEHMKSGLTFYKTLEMCIVPHLKPLSLRLTSNWSIRPTRSRLLNNPLIDSMSEKEMNAQFERECKRFRLAVLVHTHISKHSTPGFPDYCATNGTHTLFAEFKTAKGKLTLFQYNWLVNLLATGHRAYVVTTCEFRRLA